MTHGFSFFEVFISMTLLTFALLAAMKQQWYIHRVVLQLLSTHASWMMADDEIFRI
jgi:Tfp pilus assembly protein PilV